MGKLGIGIILLGRGDVADAGVFDEDVQRAAASTRSSPFGVVAAVRGPAKAKDGGDGQGGEGFGESRHRRHLMRHDREAGDQPALGGKGEEGAAVLAGEPRSILRLGEVDGEAAKGPAGERRFEASAGAGLLVVGQPAAFEIGEDQQPAGVVRGGVEGIIDVASIIADAGADDDGVFDAVCVHLVEQLPGAGAGRTVRHRRLIGPVLPDVAMPVDDHAAAFRAARQPPGFRRPWSSAGGAGRTATARSGSVR